MIKRIHPGIAVKGIIAISLLVIVFHLLVITQIIPYQIVWGGKIKIIGDMYVFESISIIINVLIILLVRRKQAEMRNQAGTIFTHVLVYFFFFLFLLNTVGNLLAEKNWETILFTPITLVLAMLFLRLAMEKPKR